MSQENVEIVRSIYAKWAVGDFSDTSWAAPEIEFTRMRRAGGAVRDDGAGAMANAWRYVLASWDALHAYADEMIEAGDEVVVLGRFSGKGRMSGFPVDDMPGASVFSFKEGQVVRLVLYSDHHQALEAAGLTE